MVQGLKISLFGFHSHCLFLFAILIRNNFHNILFRFLLMKKQKTQQFSKFFLKDLKKQTPKNNVNIPDLERLSLS